MIRVQTVDGQWSTVVEAEHVTDVTRWVTRGSVLIEVQGPAHRREFVATAHVVRIIETDGDA